MDSKGTRLCIIGTLSVMVLIVLLVVYMNQEKTQNTSNPVTITQNPSATLAPQVQEETGIRTDKGLQIGYALSGFLQDEDFFDETAQTELVVPASRQLSFITTSVEKDLRIRIVNGEGSTVTGESFYISIEGLGEYKDLDKDGIIYIGDMKSGQYDLSLNSAGYGYEGFCQGKGGICGDSGYFHPNENGGGNRSIGRGYSEKGSLGGCGQDGN